MTDFYTRLTRDLASAAWARVCVPYLPALLLLAVPPQAPQLLRLIRLTESAAQIWIVGADAIRGARPAEFVKLCARLVDHVFAASRGD